MKNIYVISFFIFLFNYAFSQDSENRSKRDWNEGNQSTYSIENKTKLIEAIDEDDDSRISPIDSEFNGFNKNHKKVDATNPFSHRRASVWSDNSTIVSDEKTGNFSYIPYPYVSEDDVLWAKRVRRKIDLRMLQNHPLYFPIAKTYDAYEGWEGDGKSIENGRGSGKNFNEVLSGIDARKNLFQILRDAATSINPATGEPLVGTYNMSLTRKLTAKEVIPNWDGGYPNAFGYRYDNADEDDDGPDWVYDWYKASDVLFYYLEEEVFFDPNEQKIINMMKKEIKKYQ